MFQWIFQLPPFVQKFLFTQLMNSNALKLQINSFSLKNGFVNLDDPLLVTQNPHMQHASVANIGYVFTHLDPELYIPLTFLSYQMETWILGNAAWHYHLLNVLLHLGCIVLVYTLILRLTKKKVIAVIVTALFALHPINAETVLWVSSRKDLLCTFFTLASLLSFLEFRDSGIGCREFYFGS
jgi:dolichyl-phosphate-mannose--protein O-mannosyl transferase